MKTVSITIAGTTPIILNRFTDEAAEKATSGKSGSFVGNRGTPQEIAESKLYTDESGKVGVPGPNVFRCLIDAGKFFKNGKSKLTTQKSSLIPAAASLNEAFVHIKHKQPWTVDTRPVRIPSTGGRILAHRPSFDDWEISFSVDLDESVIAEGMFREVVDTAGTRIGLGDFRPDCKGMFGKFKVTSWKATNGA